jgi:phospholipid transport system substrate-binding protein
MTACLTVSLTQNETGLMRQISAKHRFMGLFSALFLLALLPAGPVWADRTGEAEQLVTEMMGRAKQAVENTALDEAGKQAEVSALLTSYFDVDGIARAATGQYWRSASAEERSQYQALFLDTLVRTAASQFDQFRGLEFQATASSQRGDKMVLVGGVIRDPTGQRPQAVVNWRLTTLPGQPARIIDIEIENISMLMTQRQENIAIIRKNGGQFSALITSLQAAAN